MAATWAATIAGLEVALDQALDAPLFEALTVERLRAKLAAARERAAFEKREANEDELHALKKTALQSSLPDSGSAGSARAGARTPPPRALQTRARSRTPPPASLFDRAVCSGVRQAAPLGLDDDENASAAASSSEAASSAVSDLDAKELSDKLLTALRADLNQNLQSSSSDSEPTVKVEVACRALSAVLGTLNERMTRYQAIERRLKAAYDPNDATPIELNVGGERFHTTVATLLLEPSYLQGMFSGHFQVEPSPDGSYFIDRSSKWFRTILDYLRSRTMSIDLFALSKVERSELRTELEFYGITSLLEMMGRGRGLCFDIDEVTRGIRLSKDLKSATTIEAVPGSDWSLMAWASRPDTSAPQTVLWKTGLSVMYGWGTPGKRDGWMFYPTHAMRCRGSTPQNGNAPEPVFQHSDAARLMPLASSNALLELTYDPKAGTIRGRFPQADSVALTTSCLLFNNIPPNADLVPCVYFRDGCVGLSATIVEST